MHLRDTRTRFGLRRWYRPGRALLATAGLVASVAVFGAPVGADGSGPSSCPAGSHSPANCVDGTPGGSQSLSASSYGPFGNPHYKVTYSTSGDGPKCPGNIYKKDTPCQVGPNINLRVYQPDLPPTADTYYIPNGSFDHDWGRLDEQCSDLTCTIEFENLDRTALENGAQIIASVGTLQFLPAKDGTDSTYFENHVEESVIFLSPIPATPPPPPETGPPVVNSTADTALDTSKDGCDTGGSQVGGKPECTLRAAIQAVNLGRGKTITFDIPGSGNPVIHPATALPAVARSADIDATTQPSSGHVAIDGSATGTRSVGLQLSAGTSTVRGFVLNAFRTAIQADGGSGHQIVGNRIGTDLAGTAVGVPGDFGIVTTTAKTHIGGSASKGNVVLATQTAVAAQGTASEITGNDVAVGADGATPLGSGGAGGIVAVGRGATIAGNTVRSESVGIAVLGAAASGATVDGNHVGTTRDGKSALVMHGEGIRIDAAPGAKVTDNVVATAGEVDISASGSKQYTTTDNKLNLTSPSSDLTDGKVTGGDAMIRGNIVGLLGDATSAGPGASEGVWGWAGANHLTVTGNTIAGQTNTALELDRGNGHVVTGNHIGTERSGSTAFQAQEGIHLIATSGAKIGGAGSDANVIGGAHDAAVLLSPAGSNRTTSTTITGNWIGVGPGGAGLGSSNGIKITSADHTTIGPDNVVGDTGIGILLGRGSDATTITGNRIGTRGTAATGAPNTTGIAIGDGAETPLPDRTTVGPGNVISLNGTGIVSAGTTTKVLQNRIGTASASDAAVPNSGAGLVVRGGDVSANANTIAFNTPGVDVGTARVTLRGNRMFGNGTAAIVHPAAPAAPNLLAAVRTTRGHTTRTLLAISGLPAGDRGTVEVFANSSCSEPQARYVLALTKTKPAADTFALVNMIGRADRNFLTVDYTDAAGNTSALSQCRPAGTYPDSDADGAPDVLENLVGLPGAAQDPTEGVIYTDKDQILLIKTSAGRLAGLGAADDPSPQTRPAGLDLPYGLLNLEIRDVPNDGAVSVAISPGPGTPILAHGWAKYGKIPSGATTWYDFGYDDLTGTGARIVTQGTPDEIALLSFVDGARGDDDGQSNGVIRDPGGPSNYPGAQPVGAAHAPATRSTTTSSSASDSTSAAPADTGTDLAALLRLTVALIGAGAALTYASRRRHGH